MLFVCAGWSHLFILPSILLRDRAIRQNASGMHHTGLGRPSRNPLGGSLGTWPLLGVTENDLLVTTFQNGSNKFYQTKEKYRKINDYQ
jgi:hypothetical protein